MFCFLQVKYLFLLSFKFIKMSKTKKILSFLLNQCIFDVQFTLVSFLLVVKDTGILINISSTKKFKDVFSEHCIIFQWHNMNSIVLSRKVKVSKCELWNAIKLEIKKQFLQMSIDNDKIKISSRLLDFKIGQMLLLGQVEIVKNIRIKESCKFT